MTKPTNLYIVVKRLIEEEQGQDMVEYAMLLAFIGLSFGAFNSLGAADSISKLFSRVTWTVSAAGL